MVEISISDIAKRPKILDELRDIAKVVNKKDNSIRGLFIPLHLMDAKVRHLIQEIEQERKQALLKRIAQAQKEDSIGDGAVGDGL